MPSATSWRLLPRSLRGRLAASFVLFALLLSTALSLAIGARMSAGLEREEAAVLSSIARNAGRQLGEGLWLRLREVQVMAASPTIWSEGLASERVREVFKRSQALNPHSVWIGVTDDQGIVRAATGRLLEGVDVSTRPWFEGGRRADFVGDVHPAKLLAKHLPPAADGGPQRFVDFAAPIVRDGQLHGVVAIHGSWDWTRQTLEMLLPPGANDNGIELFVFDRGGRPVYAPGASLAGHLAAGQTLPRLPHDTAATVRWHDGVEALTAAVPVRWPAGMTDLGWTVVAREPVALALAPAHEASVLALQLGLAAAALAGLAGVALADALTGSLRRLADAARAIESRPMALPWTAVGGASEVHALSGALAHMTGRLQQANAVLEQRVRERTEQLQQANERLADLAHHDPLTGLLNRRGFDARMATALAGARRRGLPLSLLVVDADHFKRVNDRFGHDAGDEVLRALAQALAQRLREVDFVARLGGEEFVAVLCDARGADAARVARDLVERIAALTLPRVGRVTVSCGACEIDVAGSSGSGEAAVRDALARADAALYAVKARGRNGWQLASAVAEETQEAATA